MLKSGSGVRTPGYKRMTDKVSGRESGKPPVESRPISERGFATKVTDAIEGEWRSVTHEVVDIIEMFTDRIAYYYPRLADYIGNSLKKEFVTDFSSFYREYRRLTGGVKREDLLGRLRGCKKDVFTSLPATLVRMVKNGIKEPLRPESYRKELGRLPRCSRDIVIYSVRLFPPEHFEKLLDNYDKSEPLLEKESMLRKLPYVAIPALYKITLTEITLKIDDFFHRKGLR